LALHEEQVKDRRIQKTKSLLHEALGSLIREKPYDAIVVQEILDRANVGRSTFYMHFSDKDDLHRGNRARSSVLCFVAKPGSGS